MKIKIDSIAVLYLKFQPTKSFKMLFFQHKNKICVNIFV